MSHHLLSKSSVVTAQLRNDIPDFKVGTIVAVHYKIREGNKERIQIFKGLVTNRKGGNGIGATFTVLKNSTAQVKVERTFPIHSPLVDKIELISELQRARRSNLRNMMHVKDPNKSVRTRKVKAQ